jgi:hypothetical protein
MLSAGKYLSNLDMIFTRGDAKTVRVRFAKALCTKYRIVTKDADEALIECEFRARLSNSAAASSTDTRPYTIEVIG